MGFLALPDAHFWADPLVEQRAVTRELLVSGARGLFLDGPGAVDVEARGTLPVVACQVASHADFDAADLGRHGVLTAIEVETGRLLAERLQDQELAPAGPAGAATPSKGGVGAQLWPTELRRRLGLPWSAGRWVVRLHVGDRVSNAHEVLLERPASSDEERAAVEELLVAERRRRLSTWPAEPERRGDADAAAPPPPEQAGLTLELDRVTVLGPGARVEARLSFRLPVRPGDRTLEGAEVAGATGATAIVPVALVLVGATAPGPQVARLRLPAFDPAGAPEVTGQAVLDLRRLPGVSLGAQRYTAWLLSGEALAGPVPFTLLTEEQVLDR